MSESNGDSSGTSTLGVCLDGFNGDAWMPDAEGAQDDMQVVEAEGVKVRSKIRWCTTAWSAGADEVVPAKVGKMADESRKLPPSVMNVKTDTFDLQRVALGEDDGVYRGVQRRVAIGKRHGVSANPRAGKAGRQGKGKKCQY